MSTYLAYERYYNDLNETHPELTTDEERRAQLSRYAAGEFKPRLSEKKILEMLEKNSLTYPPHPLPRYSSAERAQRRARSEQVREAVFDFVVSTRQRGENVHVRRQYGSLWETESADNPSAHNEELARLFSSDTAQERAFEQETMQEYMSHGMSQEDASQAAKQYIASRRGEIVMNAFVERFALLEHLDELTDENLPPEQLAQNYKAITAAWESAFEAENILKDVDSGYLMVTDAQKQLVRQMQQQQDLFVDAREKLNNMSNPVYEFLDIRQLNYYDLDRFDSAYEGTMEEIGVKDALSNFVQDFSIVYSGRTIRIADAYDQTLEAYGIVPVEARVVAEDLTGVKESQATSFDLLNNKTITMERDDLAVILSRVSPDSDELTAETPGRLFDQFLTAKNKMLTKELEDADPAFLRSSKEFKAMKESLRHVNKLAPLGDSPSQRDIDRARREFSALLRSSKEYRATKGEAGKNDREQARIDVAEKLKAYAEMKLGQLNTIEKAQNTLEKYRGMTLDQIREKIQAEKPQAQAEAEVLNSLKNDPASREVLGEFNQDRMGRQFEDESLRRKYPIDWLKLKIDHYRNVEGGMDVLADSARPFSVKVTYTLGKDAPQDSLVPDAAPLATVAGSLIAMEMICMERKALNAPGVPGPLETLLTGEQSKQLAQELGERAIKLDTKKDLSELNVGDFIRFTDTFQINHLAAALSGDFRQKHAQELENGCQFTQKLATAYRDAIKPMRGEQLDRSEQAFLDFTNKQILGHAKEYDELIAAAGGDPSAEMDSSAKMVGTSLLQNCVIHSMVQLERESLGKNGPGNLEKMVQDPQKLPTLWKAVQSAPDFQKLMEEKLFRLGETPAMDTILKFMEQKEPQRIAKDLLQQAVKARQSAQTAPAKQPQRQQDAPVKQPQQPKL